MNAIARNVREYIGRYVVVATVVLLPLSGLLGQLAAEWGGAGSQLGRVVLGAASVIGTAAAVGVWLRNLGLWETAPLVAQATAEAAAATAALPAPAVIVHAGKSPAVSVGGVTASLDDPEAERVSQDDLPSDAEEFAAPPPDDDSALPVDPNA